MTDNQVVIVVQTLLYFTQLISWVTHGFMWINLWKQQVKKLTINKEKQEKKQKWKRNK